MNDHNHQQVKFPRMSFEKFIAFHKTQLKIVPYRFWRTLHYKISNHVFDANQQFEMETKFVTYSNQVKQHVRLKVKNRNGFDASDPSNIFLIQHLLNYHANEGREMMKALISTKDSLIPRFKKSMNIKETDVCQVLEKILKESWKYAVPYSIKINEVSRTLPLWGITEELGMVINHSFEPTCVLFTFQYSSINRIYSVLFPLKSLRYNEEVTRDFTLFEYIDKEQLMIDCQKKQEYIKKQLEKEKKQLSQRKPGRNSFYIYRDEDKSNKSLNSTRRILKPFEDKEAEFLLEWSLEDEIFRFKKALLIPWEPQNLQNYFSTNVYFQQDEPNLMEFYNRRLIKEPYHFVSNYSLNMKKILSHKSKVKVFCGVKSVVMYLTDDVFEIVYEKNHADIWWVSSYFIDYVQLYYDFPNCLINQFPLGHIISEKDLMSVVCRRNIPQFDGNIDPISLESYPEWLPTTFNLTTELIKFVCYFYRRELLKLDNHWIIKSPAVTNASDIFITKDLNAIIRLRGSADKIACKYIDNPVLFCRRDINELVKFELRYFVILTSVSPLKVFVYNAFQVDIANKSFNLNKLYNQESHLTDMRVFDPPVDYFELNYIDFIQQFNDQYYSHCSYNEVHSQTMMIIKEMFCRATEKVPFGAINHNANSSALYQVDVMLKWVDCPINQLRMQPMIIDCNFNPKCDVICSHYPNFFNDVFKVMFLEDENNPNIQML